MTANSAIVPPAAVAVIGLGNMGVPMGLRLIKAGFTVTGYDVSETARQNFAAAGGRIADHVAAAVAAPRVGLTPVSDREKRRHGLDEASGEPYTLGLHERH